MNLGERVGRWGEGTGMPQISVLILRIGLGILYLWAGLDKLIAEYAGEGWSATGYLLNSTHGPLAEFFGNFANNSFVDGLVMWGLTLIGVSLILGAAVRWGALAGIAITGLFYLTQLPPEHGWVSERLIYILGLNMLAVMRAGAFLGVDGWLDELEERYPPLKYVLR